MKIKKSTMRVINILLILMLMLSFATQVFAEVPDPKSFTGTTSNGSNKLSSFGNIILGMVQVVAVAVAVIMLIVLGVKYMSAAPSDKADIKKSATGYILGAVLLFGASGVLGIIKNLGESLK